MFWWLPGSVAQSVLVDSSAVNLPSVAALRQRERIQRRDTWPSIIGCLEAGETGRALAGRLGISRAAVSRATRLHRA
jgi:hypothetical protein